MELLVLCKYALRSVFSEQCEGGKGEQENGCGFRYYLYRYGDRDPVALGGRQEV